MKLLVDESLPRGLKRELAAHDVTTVVEMGWAGRTNGELLELAKDDFDVFLTADQGIRYEQNLSGSDLAVVVLAARTNRLEDLRPLIHSLLELLPTIGKGEIRTLAV